LDRRRTIAGAPFRGSTQAWTVIEELISNTLTASPDISSADVRSALDVASEVGRHLVAGGYLTKSALVLVAGSLRLEIHTVTGDEALTSGDDATAVPGAAQASDWLLYLPTPDPLGKIVKAAAERNQHLSSDAPPDTAEPPKSAGPAIDRDAIRRLRGDKSS
jgi:hypothetical protein